MKIDGRAIAKEALKRKSEEAMGDKDPGAEAEASQAEMGDNIKDMAYFAEHIGKGDHEKAHEYLYKMFKRMQGKDYEKE